MFSIMGVSVGLFRAITYELLELVTSFTTWRIIFAIMRSSTPRSWGQRQTSKTCNTPHCFFSKNGFIPFEAKSKFQKSQCKNSTVKVICRPGSWSLIVKIIPRSNYKDLFSVNFKSFHDLYVMWVPLTKKIFYSDRNLNMHHGSMPYSMKHTVTVWQCVSYNSYIHALLCCSFVGKYGWGYMTQDPEWNRIQKTKTKSETLWPKNTKRNGMYCFSLVLNRNIDLQNTLFTFGLIFWKPLWPW